MHTTRRDIKARLFKFCSYHIHVISHQNSEQRKEILKIILEKEKVRLKLFAFNKLAKSYAIFILKSDAKHMILYFLFGVIHLAFLHYLATQLVKHIFM